MLAHEALDGAILAPVPHTHRQQSGDRDCENHAGPRPPARRRSRSVRMTATVDRCMPRRINRG